MSSDPDRVLALCEQINAVLVGHSQGTAIVALLTSAALFEMHDAQHPETPPPASVIAMRVLMTKISAELMTTPPRSTTH